MRWTNIRAILCFLACLSLTAHELETLLSAKHLMIAHSGVYCRPVWASQALPHDWISERSVQLKLDFVAAPGPVDQVTRVFFSRAISLRLPIGSDVAQHCFASFSRPPPA